MRLSRRPLALLLLFLASCRPAPRTVAPSTPPPATPSPAATPTADLIRVDPPPLSDDLSRESLIAAIDRTLAVSGRLAAFACPSAVVERSLAGLRQTAGDASSDLATYVRAHFEFQRSSGRSDGALLTGYYEPIVAGRRSAGGAFVHPLYRRPADLIEITPGDFSSEWSGASLFGRVENGKLSPYYSRREIDDEHVLAGRGLELVWLDDPVALYFLQVQGSGIVRFEDGSSVRVGFAGSNGRRYTSIGRVLADAGSLEGEPPTAPAIQRYLRAHPERRDELLFRNERYVFFREAPDGPIGKLGVVLTTGRSIAVDASLYPLGALAYVETSLPAAAGEPERRPLHRLVFAQDTGAAITGPGRVDLFFGTGDAAGEQAGVFGERGVLYFLVPRECGSESASNRSNVRNTSSAP